MRLHYTLDEISISKGGKYFINWRGLMKQFLIITTLVFYSLMLATCNSASDKLSKNIRPTSQDCNEMAQGSGALLFEADKLWDEFKNIPENSSERNEPAAKIKWLTDVAANYSVYYETFCK